MAGPGERVQGVDGTEGVETGWEGHGVPGRVAGNVSSSRRQRPHGFPKGRVLTPTNLHIDSNPLEGVLGRTGEAEVGDDDYCLRESRQPWTKRGVWTDRRAQNHCNPHPVFPSLTCFWPT